MGKVLDAYKSLSDTVKEKIDRDKTLGKIEIHIGNATCENAAGAQKVRDEFEKLIEASGRDDIIIKQTGCTGRCSAEPIIGIFTPGSSPYKYESVTEEKVRRIFTEHVINGQLVTDYLLDKTTSNIYDYLVTFYCSQKDGHAEFDAYAYFQQQMLAEGIPENKIRGFRCVSCSLFISNPDIKYYMMVYPDQTLYRIDKTSDIDRVVEEHLKGGKPVADLFGEEDPIFLRYMHSYSDVSFFNKQTRLTLRNSGIIDPESIDDYIYSDGFAALSKVLDAMSPQDVVDEVKKAALRGRGGGGFPTGLKWEFALKEDREQKYIICNADEGDPGAFMDRSALEGDPFSIIEGMIIGAYATGASKGFFYIRAEYPLAIERIEKALVKARELNLLGENILGSGFNFDLEIRLGAGAFVCGEETALIHSIEGLRGQPRIRPPFPPRAGSGVVPQR